MVAGSLAVWLNILAIASITFVVGNLAVSTVVSLFAHKFLQIEVSSRKVILWLLVILPWFSSLCVALYFSSELDVFSSIAASTRYTHWHHMTSFSFVSWHGITLLSAALLVFSIVYNKSKQLFLHKKEMSLLSSFATPMAKGVYQIDSPQASAFTSGFITKRCFITSGMLNQTTKQEQDVILRHEQAHAQRNDPLKKWLYSILATFFIAPLSARLKLHMTLAMEQDADDAVITNELSSTFVATTLVKVTSNTKFR